MPKSSPKKLSYPKVAADGHARKRVKRGPTKSTRTKVVNTLGVPTPTVLGGGGVLNMNPGKTSRFYIIGADFQLNPLTGKEPQVDFATGPQGMWTKAKVTFHTTYLLTVRIKFIRKTPPFLQTEQINVTVTNDGGVASVPGSATVAYVDTEPDL